MRDAKKLSRGLLIAVEGIDGAGKSAQAEILYRKIKDMGYPVILLHEPTDGFYGKKIKKSMMDERHDPYKEFEYFMKDRKEDVNKNVKPSLDKRMIVIMDRYYFSTVAYQGAVGIDINEIKEINEKFFPKPDLTLILDVNPDIGLSRIREKRNDKPNLFERKRYLTRVRDIFKQIRDPSIKILDGALSVEKLSEKILSLVLSVISVVEKDPQEKN